jgi:predicted Zn-dependent peptidase
MNSPFVNSPLDRHSAPELGPPPAIRLPPTTVTTLSNGLTVMVVERHELPLATFRLVVPRGSAFNPPAHAGAAGLMSDMLLEGTATRSSLEIADEAAFLGIALEANSTWDATTITLNAPTAQLDRALPLFADLVLQPAFSEHEFERLKKERLTELLQLRDHGPAIANRLYATLLFGTDHPYGRPATGTEQSVGSMSVETVKSFYKYHFDPKLSTLIVVGDVTPASVEAVAESLFGEWRGNDTTVAAVDVVPPKHATTIHLVDKPGAEQASFRIGCIGAARSTADYFPIHVMNTILGGAFTSRLNQNLRERNGYTYGAFSRFDMRMAAGPFTASSEIGAMHADSALREFLHEFNAIHDVVSLDELTKAKQYLALQLPGTFETNTAIAQRVTAVALYGLPLDYYNQYVDRIDAVTQADVQRVAQTYITPESLTIVIVADRRTVEPSLRALHVAPVQPRDFHGAAVHE